MVYARWSPDGSDEGGTNLPGAIKSCLCIRQNVLLPDLMNEISSLQQFRRLIP